MFVRSQHFFRIPKGFFCNKALFRVCLLDESRVLVAEGRGLVGTVAEIVAVFHIPLAESTNTFKYFAITHPLGSSRFQHTLAKDLPSNRRANWLSPAGLVVAELLVFVFFQALTNSHLMSPVTSGWCHECHDHTAKADRPWPVGKSFGESCNVFTSAQLMKYLTSAEWQWATHATHQNCRGRGSSKSHSNWKQKQIHARKKAQSTFVSILFGD